MRRRAGAQGVVVVKEQTVRSISEGGWGPQGGERIPSNDPDGGSTKSWSMFKFLQGVGPHLAGNRATLRNLVLAGSSAEAVQRLA